MSSQKENGTTTESMPCSKPLTSANAKSKRSTVTTQNVQLSEAKEADSQAVSQKANGVDKWVKFTAWFGSMGAVLWYGMSQHDNSLLCLVMILVTVGCGYGHAVEMLLPYLPKPTKH